MLVDAHCHLDDYESELEMAVASIQMNRILSISTSMDFFSYQRVLSIAQDCPFVIPAFGVHPWNAAHYWKNLTHLAKFIQDAPLIGEIGMDFHFIDDVEVYPKQERIFEFFLKGAREFGTPAKGDLRHRKRLGRKDLGRQHYPSTIRITSSKRVIRIPRLKRESREGES